MTVRAFLWHGALRGPLFDPKHRRHHHWDFPAGRRDLEFATQAALALGAHPDDIHAFVCNEDLLPDEFGSSRHPATVSALQRQVEAIAQRSSGTDALLFVAGNHGLPCGLLTSPPSDELIDEFSDAPTEPLLLTPAMLEACLSRLPGQQVLVIATCYAGVFLPLGERPDRLVLVGCAGSETYQVEDEERPHSPFLVKLLGAWCGIALPGDVAPAGRLSLDDAFAAAARDLDSPSRTKPLRQGAVVWPQRPGGPRLAAP